jgi:peptidoglycan/xylan/chitin deacetylase (PgdA/CDA1 family)
MSLWSHLAAVAAISLAACQSVRTQEATPPPLDQPVTLTITGQSSAAPTPTPGPAPIQYTYNSVPGAGRAIAITFDDGPSEKLTPMLLDILKERNVHATFFVVGQNAAEYPDILKRAVAEGHEIGNHSWSHPSLTGLGAAGVKNQMQKTNAAIKAAIGRDPVVMRPPYGATNATLNKRYNDVYGMKVILWSVDPLDWKYRSAAHVKSQILAQVTPGAIILAHDIHATTVAAMPGTLDALLSEGYKFVTVSQLIAMQGRQPAEKTPAPTTSATPSPAPSNEITVPPSTTSVPSPTPKSFDVNRYDPNSTSEDKASQ